MFTFAGKMDLFDRFRLASSFALYFCRAISVLLSRSALSLKPGILSEASAASIATRSRDFAGRLDSSPRCAALSCRRRVGKSPNSRHISSNFGIASTRVMRSDPLITPVLSSKNLTYILASRSATVSFSYAGALSASSSLSNTSLNLDFRSARLSFATCLKRNMLRSVTPSRLADVLVESSLVTAAPNSFLFDRLSVRYNFRVFSCNLAVSSTSAAVFMLANKGAPLNFFVTTLILDAAMTFACAS